MPLSSYSNLHSLLQSLSHAQDMGHVVQSVHGCNASCIAIDMELHSWMMLIWVASDRQVLRLCHNSSPKGAVIMDHCTRLTKRQPSYSNLHSLLQSISHAQDMGHVVQSVHGCNLMQALHSFASRLQVFMQVQIHPSESLADNATLII